LRLGICISDILTGSDYQTGWKAETASRDEEILQYGNRELTPAPGSGMERVQSSSLFAGVIDSLQPCPQTRMLLQKSRRVFEEHENGDDDDDVY
jgi:hypothetical protein